MSRHSWKYHAGRLLLAAVAVLAAGVLVGHPVAFTAAAAIVYAAWHLANLWLLYRWLHHAGKAVPESLGIWKEIYDRIDELEKSDKRQRDRYVAMIGEFRNLTNAFPDATLVIDEHDNLTWFNSSATRLLELSDPGDLGLPVTNLVRNPDFADWLAIQPEIRSPLEMPSPRGDNRWLNVNAVPFDDRQRLIILRDVTEVHNVEQVRRDFVANISHELRTPLTVLQGYLELLDQHRGGDIGEAVQKMLAQTGQMQNLLDDLLELSRLQTREARNEDRTINVPAMLLQLKEQAEELSQDRHHLHFEVDHSVWLEGIFAEILSAFGNLISNAIKYTPDGGSITVVWGEDAGQPLFSVTDSGIGIPRRAIPRLTERFYRVGSDRARQTGGTGLGLAIVKHVLNAHQASLSIESELGEGSRFTCLFPADRRRVADA